MCVCVDVCACVYVCSLYECMRTRMSACASECVHCVCVQCVVGPWGLPGAQPWLTHVFSTSTCLLNQETRASDQRGFSGSSALQTHTRTKVSRILQGPRLLGGNPRGMPTQKEAPRRAGLRSAASKLAATAALLRRKPVLPGLPHGCD